jgi:glycosyltransferase involved in cell wall biosynthesis
MNVLAAILCFNERMPVASVVTLARKHVDETLVIDDGSRDGTAAVATAAGATVIRHEQNKGKGAAVKSAELACIGAACYRPVGVKRRERETF